MSGLLALLDDVVAIAKLATSQLDDVAAQAMKASSKTAGVIIDDAAVTPKYVTGLPAARELPIVAKIARGSLFNKIVILLPALLFLQAVAPWMIPILLIIGGAYLCFEGAEKTWHAVTGHTDSGPQRAETLDAAHLEQHRVKGAIKTDFILSAEIMTIALASIDADTLWSRIGVLVVVAIFITVLVYGSVAVLVKLDDVGLRLNRSSKLPALRALGRWLVVSMPTVLSIIALIGTAAMLWVGGSIIIHGASELGWPWPYETIKSIASVTSDNGNYGLIHWLTVALIDAAVGLLVGLMLVPVVARLLFQFTALFPEQSEGANTSAI